MFDRTLRTTVLGLAALVLPAALSAQGSIELGGFGTYTQFDESLGLTDRTGGGARFSVISGSGWSTFLLEAEGAYVTTPFAGANVTFIPARARLVYGLPIQRAGSFLIGAGAVRNNYKPDGGSAASEWGYSGLVGFRFNLGSYMALRIDGIYDYMANPINEGPLVETTSNMSAQAGLSFPIWRDRRVPEPRPEPVVREEPREVAVAPAPAPESRSDEPDADRDGVADSRDACSNTLAGALVDRDGCQVYRDSDGDGVVDQRDACPATAANESIDGRGCPVKDTDMDGVSDSSDRCPNTAAGTIVNAAGCPMPATPAPDGDADGDSVPDSKDKCPTTKPGARVDVTGCAILEGSSRTITLKGVRFATWSDELTPASLAILDDVAEQLVAAPDVKVEVAGHTDAGGARARNIKLSLARAESVRAYLIMKGVPAERLVARGYGPDSPIASNKTEAGRALNRRVELRRID
jgi:outer membrane protein OmpA-like peptidoglycan-associated protein